MSDFIYPFDIWPQQIVQASVPANRNALRSQILNSKVLSDTLSVQPEIPTEGDLYIIPAGASGSAWSTYLEDDLAIFVDGSWYAFSPNPGIKLVVNNGEKIYTDQGWVDFSGGSGASDFTDLSDVPGSYSGNAGKILSVKSDESGLEFINNSNVDSSIVNLKAEFFTNTDFISTGNTLLVPFNCEILGWYISCETNSSASFDIRKGNFSSDISSFVSITNSDFPTITSQKRNQSANVDLWNTTINAGEMIYFVLQSSSSELKQITIYLRVEKT